MAGPTIYTQEYNVLDALALRFSDPEWCFLRHVHSATGFNQRQADALALNLWKTRGHELYGFEVKCRRGDLLKELKDPAKSHKIAKFCDRWYLVLGNKMLIKNEDIIPHTWGVIIPSGKTMRIVRKAKKLKPEKWHRSFIAAIFRRVQEQKMNKKELREAQQAGYNEGYKAAQKHTTLRKSGIEGQYDALQKRVATFEKASGVSIQHHWSCGQLGKAVNDVLHGRHLDPIRALAKSRDELQSILTMLDSIVETAEGDKKNG